MSERNTDGQETTPYIDELVTGLRVMLSSDEDCGAAVRLVSESLKAGGAEVEIDENDDHPDSLSSEDGTLWVVSKHKLVVVGETVAEWNRCSMGTYGESGRQCSDDEWRVSEDTNGGDTLPDKVAVALEVFGVEDAIPAVPEPDKATKTHEEDDAGEYAVYWETVGDDAHVVARYATRDAAGAVCEQKNREFSACNPSGGGVTYLCGYGVRELVNGEWVRASDDE